MQNVAIVFFCIAALLSAWLMPNNLFLLQLTVVSMARALALILALVFWVASGRLDSWGSSRVLVGLGTVVGALSLAAGCLFVQVTRDDNVPVLWAWVYRLTAALLPICFFAAVFLRSGKMFLIVSLLAPVAGVLVAGSWKSLNAEYNANTPEAKERRRIEALVAARMAELDRIPSTAGPEPLLEFIVPVDSFAQVRIKAEGRIEAMPDWIERLSTLLDGEKRLNALFVLTQKASSLPDPLLERCWTVAESIAKERTELVKKGTPSETFDEQMLYDSVYEMGNQSEATREKHCRELVAVQDFLLTAKANINAAYLDGWIRKAQLHLIPEDAGIVPLLAFVGPEAYDVREEALTRIAKVPDWTTKLDELLDGPHRLGAFAALAMRAGELPPDLRERSWRVVGPIAREMAAGIKQGNPPNRIDMRKLSLSVSLLWVKLDPNHSKDRLADLAVVREVVQAVGVDWEKGELLWADQVLAAGAGAGKTK